jgi:hypothetical protein
MAVADARGLVPKMTEQAAQTADGTKTGAGGVTRW